MGWKMWVVASVFMLGLALNVKELWSPQPVSRTSEESRRLALVALFLHAFILYAIFNCSSTVE